MRLWEFENQRNADNEALWREMIMMAYPDVDLVVAGHHIFYRRDGERQPEEIPSADAIIFDHKIAQAVWGPHYKNILAQLACEPVETRDALLKSLFDERKP
jgi:hypothetical protein